MSEFSNNSSLQSENSENDKNEESESNHKIQSVSIPEGFPRIVIDMEEFTKEFVGAKSNNTKRVFGNLPSWIKYPQSIAIPFNVCEHFLNMDENSKVRENLENYTKLIKSEKGQKISTILENCKKSMMELKYVESEETEKLKSELVKFGVKESEFNSAWKSIKGVWASKYNERAFLATQKVGISLDDIRMAVLVQKIIPADFAFVIHTKNPSTNDENEVYAEVVAGMGETLVGFYEGQSFAFTYNKKTQEYNIQSYPNKSISLKNQGFIFRSDSNTEDLEGFAGAGLFDSIPLSEHKEVHMAYHTNEIFTDENFAKNLMAKIAQMGVEVENIYEYPQDIEGVLYNDEFYIVQTRPQV